MSSSINGEDMALHYLYVDNLVTGGEVEWGGVSFCPIRTATNVFSFYSFRGYFVP